MATEFLAGSNNNDLEFLRVRTSNNQYHQLIADANGIRLDSINGSTNTTRWQAALKSDLENCLVYRGSFKGDFNNINISPGIYTIHNISDYTNGPSKIPGFCCFMQLPTYKVQVIINAMHIFTRKYTGDPPAWSNWATYTGVN